MGRSHLFSAVLKLEPFNLPFICPLSRLIYFGQKTVPRHFSSTFLSPKPFLLSIFIFMEAVSLLSSLSFFFFTSLLWFFDLLSCFVFLSLFFFKCKVYLFISSISSRSPLLFSSFTHLRSLFSLALIFNLLRWPLRNPLLHPLEKPPNKPPNIHLRPTLTSKLLLIKDQGCGDWPTYFGKKVVPGRYVFSPDLVRDPCLDMFDLKNWNDFLQTNEVVYPNFVNYFYYNFSCSAVEVLTSSVNDVEITIDRQLLSIYLPFR